MSDSPWILMRKEDLDALLDKAIARARDSAGQDEWLTPDAVAELLGVTRETVITYTRREGLPCSRAGKRLMFRRDRVNAWLEQRSEDGPRRRSLRSIPGGK